MNEQYGNYDHRVQQQQTTQSDLNTEQAESSKSISLQPADPKTAEVSKKIFSETSEPKTADSLENRNVTPEEKLNGNGASAEKADTVGPAVISLANGQKETDSEVDQKQESEKQVTNQKPLILEDDLNPLTDSGEIEEQGEVEETVPKDPALLNKIMSMDEDALEEAMGSGEFDDYIEEILERLELLSQENKEAKSEFQETKKKELANVQQELETAKTEMKTSETLRAEAIQAAKDLGMETEDSYAVIGGLAIPFSEVEDPSLITVANTIIKHKETQIFMAPKEITEQIKEGQIKFKNKDTGEYEYQIHDAREFTDEERNVLEGFIAATFMPVGPIAIKEESHKEKEANVSSKVKYTESEGLPKDKDTDNVAQAQVEKAKVRINPEAKSSFTPIQQRYKRTQEELKRKEDKINDEVLKHEKLVEDIKVNHLRIDVKTTSIDVENIKAQNIELENEFKEVLNEYLEVVRYIEKPEPLREQFKEFIISFHKFDKIIQKPNDYPPEMVTEAIAYKREVFNTIQSMISDTGGLANVSKGQGGGRSR